MSNIYQRFVKRRIGRKTTRRIFFSKNQLENFSFRLVFFVEIADKNGENQLDPDEFMTFYRQVTRRDDLYEIMQKFDGKKNIFQKKIFSFRNIRNSNQFDSETIFFSAEELLRFLRDEQKVKIETKRKEKNLWFSK